jgi:cytochrome c553
MGILKMKQLLALWILLLPMVVAAAPASNIAWTPKQLRFVNNADLDKGKELAVSCAGCHGEQGVSQIANFPSLAGQLATYTYKQLRDYADGKRFSPLMNSVATGLSEQDSANLAVWFASLTAPEYNGKKQGLEKAVVLVEKGNGKKIIPPCFTCHGSDGMGERQDIPALAGQQPEYFANTFKAYKSGARHNDVYSRMRLIAEQLSDAEIEQLAQYYYQLKR